MEIKPNYKNIFTRVFVLVMLSIILFLIINYGIIINKEKKNVFGLCLVVLMMSFVYVGLFLSLFGVISVQIDMAADQLMLNRFLRKRGIPLSEITQYYRSVYRTKKGTTYGLVLVTNNSKLTELNPGNLQDVMGLEELLINRGIKLKGERFSSYPYTAAL